MKFIYEIRTIDMKEVYVDGYNRKETIQDAIDYFSSIDVSEGVSGDCERDVVLVVHLNDRERVIPLTLSYTVDDDGIDAREEYSIAIGAR